MERHLDGLVRVLVVHVVDDVQRVDVGLRQPVHHRIQPVHDLLVGEDISDDGREPGADLLAADLVATAVERIEQRLRQVHPRAEELHLLSDPHRGDAAGDGAVVAELGPHQVVRLVLDAAGIDGRLDHEPLEALGQPWRPEHGDIRLGRGAQVVEGVQGAEGGLGDQGAPVLAHPAHHLGDPDRVAAEELVVLGRAEEPDDPPLDDQVVDDLLGLLLGELSLGEVALEVDVPEGGQPAGGHRRAVLLLDGCQVAEVRPLHRLPGVLRRAGDVVAVPLGHLLELLERADLLGELLAEAHHLLGGVAVVEVELLLLLLGDQEVDPVEGHPPVVADDPPAAVRVGQPGQHVRRARLADGRGVGVEDAVIVGLAVLGEDLCDIRVRLHAVAFQARRHHPPPAVRHDRPLQRSIGLQTDDDLGLPVDVPGLVGEDARGNLAHPEDSLLALLGEQGLELLPQRGGPLRRAGQERAITLVRRVVLLDEVADVHPVLPGARGKPPPRDLPGLLGSLSHLVHGDLLRSRESGAGCGGRSSAPRWSERRRRRRGSPRC